MIPTHEFAGNLDERLDFPGDWDINVMHMKGYGAPPLTYEQMAQSLDKPVGAKPLREVAAGKKTVVITFDDLTRATPTYTVVPWVVSELKAAGIQDENIVFLGSFATHRPMTAEEVRKKIGPDIERRFAWTNHECFFGTKEIGTTSFKTKVQINETFLDADLKITLSGIKVHYDAGYGGGAKAVLPGVAHIDTIEQNHNKLLRETKTAGPVRIFKNEMRMDLIEAARMANIDFSVQIMYDHKLRPIRVFSGDIVDAHHAAVRVAADTYCTPTLQEPDIVVSNAYPQNAQAFHGARWMSYSIKEGGTGVLIIQHPLTMDPIHFLNNRAQSRMASTSYFDRIANPIRMPRQGPKFNQIVYSQYIDRNLRNRYRGATLTDSWEEVITTLQANHKGSVKVALYPYGGMQHQEIELDG